MNERVLSEDPIIEEKRVRDNESLDLSLRKNIELLSKLNIEKNGSHYLITDLIEHEFNLEAYSYRYLLPNTTDSNCVQFGSYKMYLIDPDMVLIYHKTK